MISPIAFHIGPFGVRWYSFAYLFGVLGGWFMANKLARKAKSEFTPLLISDFVAWAVVGIILGARIGYVLFYNPSFYFSYPSQILAVWKGGMSFHGGFLGIVLASLLFAKKHKISILSIGDILACVAPLGLMLGRCANFVNGELYGRIALDLPWAVSFPSGGGFPRHPSQLYEAVLEGLIPLIVLNIIWFVSKKIPEMKGFMSGVFLVWYAIARFSVEFVREPDVQIGYLFSYFTMGQLLCLPLFFFGGFLILRAVKKYGKTS